MKTVTNARTHAHTTRNLSTHPARKHARTHTHDTTSPPPHTLTLAPLPVAGVRTRTVESTYVSQKITHLWPLPVAGDAANKHGVPLSLSIPPLPADAKLSSAKRNKFLLFMFVRASRATAHPRRRRRRRRRRRQRALAGWPTPFPPRPGFAINVLLVARDNMCLSAYELFAAQWWRQRRRRRRRA